MAIAPRVLRHSSHDEAALLDACGVEDVPLGELDLTPGLIGWTRAERGDVRCPSLKGITE